MRFPSIHYNPEYTTVDEHLEQLFESLDEEEQALAKLLDIETEKILTFIGTKKDFPFGPSDEEINSFARSLKKVSSLLFMKKWMHTIKLNNAILMKDKLKNLQISTASDNANRHKE